MQKSVSLEPSESKEVGFEVIPQEARSYTVEVNGLRGSFRAYEITEEPFTIDKSLPLKAIVYIDNTLPTNTNPKEIEVTPPTDYLEGEYSEFYGTIVSLFHIYPNEPLKGGIGVYGFPDLEKQLIKVPRGYKWAYIPVPGSNTEKLYQICDGWFAVSLLITKQYFDESANIWVGHMDANSYEYMPLFNDLHVWAGSTAIDFEPTHRGHRARYEIVCPFSFRFSRMHEIAESFSLGFNAYFLTISRIGEDLATKALDFWNLHVKP